MENKDKLDRENLKVISGGADPGQPHFEGKTCPECQYNKLHFVKFEKRGDKIVEVYNCSYCGPVVMHLDWDYGY